jgi:molybdopterin biosynthesis enzyme
MIQAGKIVATIKIIPFAVVERHLRAAEAVAREARGVVSVRPLKSIAAALILTGGPAGKAKTIAAFEPAIRSRLEALGATLLKPTYYIAEDREEIAHTLRQAVRQGAGLVIIAGETSIMDINDITPQGIVQAGGRVEHYGAPVEPGNLLLLAYLGDVPVIGAPGCARSKSTNIMDLILPRLLTGERLTRKDIIALGNGGLL